MRKKITAAVAAIVAVVLAAVVAKALATAPAASDAADEPDAPAALEQPAAPAEDPAPDQAADRVPDEAGTEEGQGDEAREGALTERQDQLRASYSEIEAEAAALLEANVWADETGTATLSFGEEVAAERKDGMADVEWPWAVSLAERSEQARADGSGTEEEILVVVDLGQEERTVTLSRFHPASGAEQPWTVSSGAFRYASSYTAASSSAPLSVVDAAGELATVCEGEENAARLGQLIAAIAAAEYPTATKAVWQGQAEYDYKARTVAFEFELDNRARTRIRVLHPLGTASFETDKGAAL